MHYISIVWLLLLLLGAGAIVELINFSRCVVARHTRIDHFSRERLQQKENDAEKKKTIWTQSTPHPISNVCKIMFNVHTHFSTLFATHARSRLVYLWRVQWHKTIRETYRKKRDFPIQQEDRTNWSDESTETRLIKISINSTKFPIEMFTGIDVNRTESCQKSMRINFTRRNVFHLNFERPVCQPRHWPIDICHRLMPLSINCNWLPPPRSIIIINPVFHQMHQHQSPRKNIYKLNIEEIDSMFYGKREIFRWN